MSYLVNQYKQRFREVLEPLGFKLYKKTFYRIVNDVLQIIILVRTSDSCSIEFDIIPLSIGIDDLFWEAGYNITHFCEGRKGLAWWFESSTTYPQNSKGLYEQERVDNNIDVIIADMLSIVVSCVIPIFIKGMTDETAYNELIKIEDMIHTDPYSGVKPDYGLALLCIQSQNYEKAYQHMIGIVERWDRAYKDKVLRHNEKENANEPDLLFNRFILEYKELKELFYKLSIPDEDYLQKFIAAKIRNSIEYLKHPK